MTPKQSTARLLCYIAAAMLSAVTTGIMSVDFSDWRQAVVFVCGVLGAGVAALRAYIDQSPTQVEKP